MKLGLERCVERILAPGLKSCGKFLFPPVPLKSETLETLSGPRFAVKRRLHQLSGVHLPLMWTTADCPVTRTTADCPVTRTTLDCPVTRTTDAAADCPVTRTTDAAACVAHGILATPAGGHPAGGRSGLGRTRHSALHEEDWPRRCNRRAEWASGCVSDARCMSRKIRKFRTDKFDTCNKQKY